LEKLPLWVPDEARKKEANITKFTDFVSERTGQAFPTYNDLYAWSIADIPRFWALMWEYGGIKFSKSYGRVLSNPDQMFHSRWFEGARLNFAENLLRRRDAKTAIIAKGEADAQLRRITYEELYDQVARFSHSLKEMGVVAGDRVAGFMPNIIETVIAMLAATSIGAVWSSCSPEFGTRGALDRFAQIRPKVLVTVNGYTYNGMPFNTMAKINAIASRIPSLERVVVVPYTEAEINLKGYPNAVSYRQFISPRQGLEIEFAQLPFDHPVYILYSSGTTGAPKGIVHGAGGTLIQLLKELILHTDLKKDDTIFYFTTCGWMMWNWLVNSLAAGSTIVLYDGSPFYPHPGTLFQLAEEVGITIFGASARYLALLEQSGVKPGREYNLKQLKSILSTGSPLSVESFKFVYREIKQDLCLSSISGGTDIISNFAAGNPTLPVYAGELQCRSLGMKVEAFDPEGNPVFNQKAELVCTAPFPSMPVCFWNDPDRQKYRSAYFDTYPNVWRHGDYIEITDTGGVIVYGRSDATLNPGGVRIGTAEIYRLVEAFPEIDDSLVVGQKFEGDERVILFVKMAKGEQFSEELKKKISAALKENASPRHVPARIIPIGEIPYTINHKKVELAVKKIIHGEDVPNREAIANPQALELYRNLEELKR
jgi:acetoacetyl-CoA synthetase